MAAPGGADLLGLAEQIQLVAPRAEQPASAAEFAATAGKTRS